LQKKRVYVGGERQRGGEGTLNKNLSTTSQANLILVAACLLCAGLCCQPRSEQNLCGEPPSQHYLIQN